MKRLRKYWIAIKGSGNILKGVSIFLAFIISVPFHLNAQYRRGHTDVTCEMARLLREPTCQDYYFSLLPPDISRLVCKMSDLDVESKLEGALSTKNKENAIFLGSLSLAAFRKVTREYAFGEGKIFAARLFVSTNPDMQSDELYEGLSQAVYKGFTDIIKCFLDAGANPNRHGKGDCSLLSMAIHKGNLVCMKDLLAAGADPNKRGGKFYNPPLVTAVEKNDIETVKLLLSLKADPNKRAKGGQNALYFAAENNNLEMVRLLLAHGCDAQYLPPWKISSPLEQAALHGNIEMVRLLLDAGARPNIQMYKRKIDMCGCGTGWGYSVRECPAPLISEIEKLLEQARARIKKEEESSYLSLLPDNVTQMISKYVIAKKGVVRLRADQKVKKR